MISQRRTHRVRGAMLAFSVIAVAMLAFSVIAVLVFPTSALAGPAAPNAITWVGNLSPTSATVASGASQTFTVEAYKPGTTDVISGDSFELECHLYWSKVSSFGGAWQAEPFDTLMTFKEDAGLNDRYEATVTPLSGLYEFKAYCFDVTDPPPYPQVWATMPPPPSPNPVEQVSRLTVTQPTSGLCLGAALDDNIFWLPLLHDSFSTDYRSPLGAVSNAPGNVTLRMRACRGDVASVDLRVWNDRSNTETVYPMTVGPELVDPTHGEVTFWTYDLAIPTDPTILYYTFRLHDGGKTVYYRDDDPKFYGGGYGTPTDDQGAAETNSYQLTVFDQNFATPEWMQRGIVYQVFPDRFRDGNSGNNPNARFYYNEPGGTISRSYASSWNTLICDPRAINSPACSGHYGDNFYGGDLNGLAQKINDGYLSSLGVSVIYLNPIFRSPSNHKYDTANYFTIDADFGGSTAFRNLLSAAAYRKIRVVLDGVFNHTSSDSAYFDRYSRWNFNDTLTSQNGPGLDDNIQACESPNSLRRSWFFISDTAPAPIGSDSLDRCDPTDTDDRGGAWTVPYSAWYGYGTLPKLNSANQGVRDFVYAKGMTPPKPSVAPYWIGEGADGWRLDVGGDIDPGLTNDPANGYWEGFRAAVKDTTVQTRTVPAIIGEEWGDASPWLLGTQWDSAMNYRLRSAELGWLFTGCQGNGCTNGTSFEDNDDNANSASGTISALTPSQFNARLRSIQEDYPPVAFKAMMNIGDSHDTNRLRFLLKKINNDDDALAQQRMKEYWLFNMTYAGAPTIYYGDEFQVQADGVWDGSTWQDDPYNRAPLPWDDTPGAYTAYTGTLPFLRALTSARQGYTPLQNGDVQHGLVISDTEKVYAFARTTPAEQKAAFIALNRDTVTHTVVFNNLEQMPYQSFQDEVFMDVLTRQTYNVACDPNTATACSLTVEVPPQLGVALVVPAKADQPKAPLPFTAITNTVDLNINWAHIVEDTNYGYEFPNRYELWTSTTPFGTTGPTGNMTLLIEAQPADFGSERTNYIDKGMVGDPAVNHYYKVVAVNGAGGRSGDSREEAEFDFALVPGQ